VAYLLIGLPKEYDSLVTSVIARTEPMSLSEVYTNLLSFEMRLISHQGAPSHAGSPVMNFASRRGHGGCSGGCGGHNVIHNGGRNSGRGPSSGDRNIDRPRYQICGHMNHTTPQCWYRYDEGVTKEEKHLAALAANPSYTINGNWYSDTGTTDHVTHNLELLVVHDKYLSMEQIQMAGGSGMPI
jgi:hypothetical protein